MPCSQFEQKSKTYNSGYSLVVTHLTTNPPVRCLNRAERTGSLVVTCSAAAQTANVSVYGIAEDVNPSCRNRKILDQGEDTGCLLLGEWNDWCPRCD
jgi:hypothetical protein